MNVQDGTKILRGIARIAVWVASNDSRLITRIARRLDADDRIDVLGYSPADDARLARHLAEHRPAVLLVDLPASQESGRLSESLKFHSALAPRVLLLVETATPALVEGILRHRLHGYLCSDTAPRDCSRAIRCVVQGDVWMSRAALAGALADLLWSDDSFGGSNRERRQPCPCDLNASQITGREQQVVMLVKQGLTNKQIGRQLGIVEETVKKHLQHIYDKIGVRRRALLVLAQPTDLESTR